MMKSIAALLLGAFFAVGSPALAETISGSVLDIHDADTLAVLHDGVKRKIRLVGIDAPEIQQTCEDQTNTVYSCGVSARQALIGLVGHSRQVRCEVQKPDRYGRLLGICYNQENIEINRALIQMGWAVSYMSALYKKDADAARIAHIGLWQGTFTAPNIWRIEQKLKKLREK